MRPLKINPGHAVTALALSPDGQKLGVAQSSHGFRLLDAVSGAELGRDTSHTNVSESSPTGRHVLYASRAEVRLAEVTTGMPFMRFQTGWTRVGDRNRPPDTPATSALQRIAQIAAIDGFDRRARVTAPSGWRFLSGGALTAAHRFLVSHDHNPSRFLVCDLAEEALVASNLDMSASRSGYEPARFAFTPDETRLLALTPRILFVFDLPRRGVDEPVPLLPSAVIRVTQPQPDPEVPPFALAPCGTKVLLRGEKSRVELRDLATGAVLTEWRWGMPKLNALAVAGDGLTAAAGGASGRAVIWDLE